MNERSVTVVNDAELIRLIHSVTRRLVLLAPGVSVDVARAVAATCRRLPPEPRGQVTVILDTEDEVFLTGLGEFEAVRIVREALHERGEALGAQPGVRIGVLLADDATLIWSPPPLLIAAGPRPADDPRRTRPNAIRLDAPPPAVAGALGVGEAALRDRCVGLDAVDSAQLDQVRTRLQVNPPQKFDVAQRVRTFNAFFQFVELKLVGVALHRRTVSLPNDLFGLVNPRTQRQFRASFSLVPPTDREIGLALEQQKNDIVRKHLRQIPEHGWVVLRCDRPALDEAVDKLRTNVKEFSDKLKIHLQKRMDGQRKQLLKALLPSVRRKPPKRYLETTWLEPNVDLREKLDHDLAKAFGSADSLIRAMAVKLQYKDVTYESLQDQAFMAKVSQAVPELAEHYSEQDAAIAPRTEPGALQSAA